jgi:hypothetical protein
VFQAQEKAGAGADFVSVGDGVPELSAPEFSNLVRKWARGVCYARRSAHLFVRSVTVL